MSDSMSTLAPASQPTRGITIDTAARIQPERITELARELSDRLDQSLTRIEAINEQSRVLSLIAQSEASRKTVLNQGPPENSCRPAVDVLFRSAANVFGPGCLGLVLTGMGQDGTRGAEHIVQAGGTVLAQDEASSVVWGMPRAVAEAGLARQILPLPLVSSELMRNAEIGRRTAPIPARAT